MSFRVEGDEEVIGSDAYTADALYHLNLEFMGSCITEEEFDLKRLEIIKKETV